MTAREREEIGRERGAGVEVLCRLLVVLSLCWFAYSCTRPVPADVNVSALKAEAKYRAIH